MEYTPQFPTSCATFFEVGCGWEETTKEWNKIWRPACPDQSTKWIWNGHTHGPFAVQCKATFGLHYWKPACLSCCTTYFCIASGLVSQCSRHSQVDKFLVKLLFLSRTFAVPSWVKKKLALKQETHAGWPSFIQKLTSSELILTGYRTIQKVASNILL